MKNKYLCLFVFLCFFFISSNQTYASLITQKYSGTINSIVKGAHTSNSDINYADYYISNLYAVGDSFTWDVTYDTTGSSMQSYNSAYTVDKIRTVYLSDYKNYEKNMFSNAIFSFDQEVETAFSKAQQGFGSLNYLAQAYRVEGNFYQEKNRASYEAGLSQRVSFKAIENPGGFTAILSSYSSQSRFSWPTVVSSTDISITDIKPVPVPPTLWFFVFSIVTLIFINKEVSI